MVKQSAKKINDVGKIVILGAGPTGLGAAYRLKELGYKNFTVIEKLDHVGGLASSFVDKQGFTWDIGGHVLFSHYTYFDELMTKALPETDWLQHERESWLWTQNTFVPYPFQNNIRYLPKEVMLNCLNGLIENCENPQLAKPANFREWILSTFGKGIADEFMFPYNLKTWAFPLEQMSYQWIGERVSVVNLKRILKNIIYNKDDRSWGPNNRFQFPKNGGTGAIWNGVTNLIGQEKFRLNAEVVRIAKSSKKCYLKDGSATSYDLILNTAPLDILVSYIDDLSTDI
ncbi:MAG: FAD-dependent oxidoreductase, partial [Candidatus Brocadiales bacterium]|nr:FAD-dependent oxidoreductase [Candidatus Brocadiales bacterium]